MPQRAEGELGGRQSCGSLEHAVRTICGTSFRDTGIAASTNSFATVLIASQHLRREVSAAGNAIRDKVRIAGWAAGWRIFIGPRPLRLLRQPYWRTARAIANEREVQSRVTHPDFGVNPKIGYPLHQLI